MRRTIPTPAPIAVLAALVVVLAGALAWQLTEPPPAAHYCPRRSEIHGSTLSAR